MTPAQYGRQGPLAKAIIDHDRAVDAENNAIAAAAVIEIGWGTHIRARRARRADLSAAAAAICNRPTKRDGGPPLAAAGVRR